MMYCEYGACMLVFVSIKLYKPKMLFLCPPQDTPSPKTASQPSSLRAIRTWTLEEPLRWARMTLPVSTRCTNAVSDILTQNYIEIRKQIHSHNRLTSSQQHSRTRKNVGLENYTSEIVTNKSESVFVFFPNRKGFDLQILQVWACDDFTEGTRLQESYLKTNFSWINYLRTCFLLIQTSEILTLFFASFCLRSKLATDTFLALTYYYDINE